MAYELDDRQTVPMTKADRKRLRVAAADLDISPGLLARALILAGLDGVDQSDPVIDSWIGREAAAAQVRWSAAGRAAVTARHARAKSDKREE